MLSETRTTHIQRPQNAITIMPGFPMGVTRNDCIRNEHVRGTLKVDGLERRSGSEG